MFLAIRTESKEEMKEKKRKQREKWHFFSYDIIFFIWCQGYLLSIWLSLLMLTLICQLTECLSEFSTLKFFLPLYVLEESHYVAHISRVQNYASPHRRGCIYTNYLEFFYMGYLSILPLLFMYQLFIHISEKHA